MSNPSIGLAAHNGQVDVRITAKADSEAQADALIAAMETELQGRIGKYVYGADNDKLENILIAALEQNGMKVAVSEVGIGTGISDTFIKSSFESINQSYSSPEALREATGISGSIRELSIQAAQRLQKETGVAVAISVVSLPDVEESADVAEATAVTVMVGDSIRTRAYGFGGKSSLSRQWVSTWALASAWWMIREHTHEG
jgi:nicotinamide-nucleotide amidase